MNYLGHTPSEHTTGARRRQGGITKAGNTHARRAMVEGAWAYRFPAKVSRHLQLRLQRLPAEEEPGTIARQEVSVGEKVEEILAGLAQRGRLSFGGLVSLCRTRLEVIVSFLAVLELIKARRAVAEQDRLFGDITLLPLPAEPPDHP